MLNNMFSNKIMYSFQWLEKLHIFYWVSFTIMDVNLRPWGKFASGVVLFVLTLERLAYYALVSTFFLFLNKVSYCQVL